MAQPVPFHNPNTNFHQRHPQQQQQPSPWGQNTNTNINNAGFYSQQQQQQPPPAPQGFMQTNTQQQYQSHGFQPPAPNQPMQPQTTQPQAPAPNLFNAFAGNNMVTNMALNEANNFLQQQSKQYIPGAYGAWGSLKYYFTLNNSYVLNKLKIILLPYRHKDWRRVPLNDQTSPQIQFSPPSTDVNAPDLYIPLMSYITYILIAGYVKGTAGEFNPDIIGHVGMSCLFLQLAEIGAIMLGLYLFNSSTSFLELFAFTGYKYVGLVINMTVSIIMGKIGYYASLLFTGSSISYFMLNCMTSSIPQASNDNRKTRNYMIFGIALLQFLLIWYNAYI